MLQRTQEFLEKSGCKSDSVMPDRGFASWDNIDFMLKHEQTFLQALCVNANWIYRIIDEGRMERLRPDSMVLLDERTYYASIMVCQWVMVKRSLFLLGIIFTLQTRFESLRAYNQSICR